jgi:protoheme IX farnesyltransferase
MYVLSCVETHTVTLLILGSLAVFWYNGVYILLKRITAFAVIPGSLVGAIPPVIGWAAAGGLYNDATILEVALFFFMWQIPHFWLMLLMFSKDYEQAGLPSLTRVFSKEQIARITTVWILAVAATGIVLAMHGQVHLPWNGAIVLASLWLAYKALGFLRVGSAYFPAFVRINVYALFVMIFLMLNAFF